jgi:hypothetical protein
VYRTTFNRTLNEIPFFLVYGRDPRRPQDMIVHHDHRNSRKITASDLDIYKSSLLNTLRQTYENLQNHKKSVALKYKTYSDKSRVSAPCLRKDSLFTLLFWFLLGGIGLEWMTIMCIQMFIQNKNYLRKLNKNKSIYGALRTN